MKRRTKSADEWVDLIEGDDKDDNQKSNTKNRTSTSRRVVGIALGATILLLLFSILKKDRTDGTTMSAQKLDADGMKRRNRKVVLLGPHDRYNDFGDILAERIITKLLVDRSGFVYNSDDDKEDTLLLGGIVTRDDMDHHGLTPHKSVYSMRTIQSMSREDSNYGPYDIVFTGGSGDGPGDEGPAILYEKHQHAVELLETEALRNSAVADRKWDCPYLFPKELLLPKLEKTEGTNTKKHASGIITTLKQPKKNYAIVDSLETPSLDKQDKGPPLQCRQVTAKADHLGFRSNTPGCSVMTKELFGAEIKNVFETEVRHELLNFSPFSLQKKDDSRSIKYIAVQHESVKHTSDPAYAQNLAEALDEVSRNLEDAPVVFFPAGRVGRPVGDHIAFGLSREVAGKMQQPSVLYETEHAFKVAALIQGAQAVVSTNLHVRILSFVFQKPRATWDGGKNHQTFLDVWEAKDVASIGMLSSVSDTWKKGLQRFFVDSGSDEPLITQSQTETASQIAVQHYVKNYEKWSNLLITPTNKDKDDNGKRKR